ncbi:Uncharacterised protein [Mycobacteroides abscessus subsp. massiliense]|nr:Uncharacterised protein [Mycobacteroides abscessus subsp. massiliense]
MTHDLAGGHFDRGGAGVAGKRGRGAEPAHIPDVADDLRGDHGTHAVHIGQSGARGGHCSLNIIGGLGDTAVELTDLADEIDC